MTDVNRTRILLIFFAAVPLAVIGACRRHDGHEGHSASAPSATRYHCPMHPTYTSARPGDCPICGMRLVPIEEKAPAADAPAGQSGTGHGVPGQASVEIPPDRQQLIGVRTARASRRSLERIVRASARVAYDPDLYGAIAEYREAVKAQERMKESPWPDVQQRSQALVRSAALRLRQMGIGETLIERLSQDGQDPTHLLLGRPGEDIWVYAQVFEFEASLVKPGQTMLVTTTALPGQKFRGRVIAVDPILNPETRTLRVRAEIPNAEGLLKPEMYVDAAIQVSFGERLAVPEEAVIDTGTRQMVFVETEPGKFDPREVEVGREAEGFVEIVKGVKEGETVVTSANFLIDSESRLKAALSGTGSGHQHSGGQP